MRVYREFFYIIMSKKSNSSILYLLGFTLTVIQTWAYSAGFSQDLAIEVGYLRIITQNRDSRSSYHNITLKSQETVLEATLSFSFIEHNSIPDQINFQISALVSENKILQAYLICDKLNHWNFAQVSYAAAFDRNIRLGSFPINQVNKIDSAAGKYQIFQASSRVLSNGFQFSQANELWIPYIFLSGLKTQQLSIGVQVLDSGLVGEALTVIYRISGIQYPVQKLSFAYLLFAVEDSLQVKRILHLPKVINDLVYSEQEPLTQSFFGIRGINGSSYNLLKQKSEDRLQNFIKVYQVVGYQYQSLNVKRTR